MPRKYRTFNISCRAGDKELLIAGLAAAGVDSFLETEEGLQIYLEEYNEPYYNTVKVLEAKKKKGILNYKTESVEERNWNEEWEKGYDPVIIKDRCLIRSAFHPPDPRYPFEIIITPKMSFGTGHHDTTSLMIEMLLEEDPSGMDVLDAGCGTGILSIAAEKSGAGSVTGYDIDPQAVENALENILLNHCHRVKILEGGAEIIPSSSAFHLIMANITRNIIIKDLPNFSRWLVPGGLLILSGFYEEDTRLIGKEADKYELSLRNTMIRNHWAVMVFEKKSP